MERHSPVGADDTSATDEQKAVHGAQALGMLSITSGLALAFAPRSSAALYALPPHDRLVRTLGARDVAVGLALLSPRVRRLGCAWRAASDALDFGLIASAVLRGERGVVAGGVRLVGAFGLVALSMRLRRAL